MPVQYASQKNPSNTLFISLPNNGTVTLRDLAVITPSDEIRAKLELETGLPSHMYRLHPLGRPNEPLGQREFINFHGNSKRYNNRKNLETL